jgi:glutathione synthase/RimK-type ligase-like ATP-grasp enzyme
MIAQTNTTKTTRVQILEELADELGLGIYFFENTSTIEFTYQGQNRYIINNDWGLNSVTAFLSAKSKGLTYKLLEFENIPSVEHRFFITPNHKTSVFRAAQLHEILEYAQKLNYLTVCKNNEGATGKDIYRSKNQKEFEIAFYYLTNKYHSICISPYFEIDVEYRVILLDFEPQVIFAKYKPSLKGNGKQNVLQLLKPWLIGKGQQKLEMLQEDISLNLNYIPKEGELVELGWQHNLSVGGTPEIVSDENLKKELSELAIRAAKALDIRFTSVDIVRTIEGLKVLEINGAVSIEKFAKSSREAYDLAKNIYRKALKKNFGIV